MSSVKSREHYRNNKQDYLDRNTAYKDVFEAIVCELKNQPCMDCGGRFPSCSMDFDHVRGEKTTNISLIKLNCSLGLLITEIKKCDLVCANCHRIRTNKRLEKKRAKVSIEEALASVIARRKMYDRAVWEEIFRMLGRTLPEPPPKPTRATRQIRKVGPKGTSWCRTHASFVPNDRFEKNVSRWNGLQGQCVDCRRKMPSRRPTKFTRKGRE